MKQKLFIIIGVLLAVIVLTAIIEILIILYSGTPVPVPNISRQPETYGSGPKLTYVVMGDSTSVGQGGDYDKGIARSTARFIARDHQVTLYNVGVSGARSASVLQLQTPEAVKLKPDVVLIAVSANDVTHLTPVKNVVRDVSNRYLQSSGVLQLQHTSATGA